MKNEKEISWTDMMRGLKRDKNMVEKQINAHRLAYAIYCETEYMPAIKTLARVLHYDETQLKKDMVDLWQYIGDIENEITNS